MSEFQRRVLVALTQPMQARDVARALKQPTQVKNAREALDRLVDMGLVYCENVPRLYEPQYFRTDAGNERVNSDAGDSQLRLFEE